jgi:hypothetical protein
MKDGARKRQLDMSEMLHLFSQLPLTAYCVGCTNFPTPFQPPLEKLTTHSMKP